MSASARCPPRLRDANLSNWYMSLPEMVPQWVGELGLDTDIYLRPCCDNYYFSYIDEGVEADP